MKAKKVVAVFMTAAMTMGMLAGCGSNNSTGTANAGSNSAESKSDAGESTDAAGTESAGSTDTSDLAGTQITMLNSKAEIQTALEDMQRRLKKIQESSLRFRHVEPVSLRIQELQAHTTQEQHRQWRS